MYSMYIQHAMCTMYAIQHVGYIVHKEYIVYIVLIVWIVYIVLIVWIVYIL